MRIRYVISTMVFWGRQHGLSLEQECELLQTLGFGVRASESVLGPFCEPLKLTAGGHIRIPITAHHNSPPALP